MRAGPTTPGALGEHLEHPLDPRHAGPRIEQAVRTVHHERRCVADVHAVPGELDRPPQQLVEPCAFVAHQPQQFLPDLEEGPPAVILGQVVRNAHQVFARDRFVRNDELVLDEAGFGDDHAEHLAPAERHELDRLHHRRTEGGRQDDAHVVGELGEQPRRLLGQFLAGTPGGRQPIVDQPPVVVADHFRGHQVVDEQVEAGLGRQPTRRDVRLAQIAHVLQVRHHGSWERHSTRW